MQVSVVPDHQLIIGAPETTAFPARHEQESGGLIQDFPCLITQPPTGLTGSPLPLSGDCTSKLRVRSSTRVLTVFICPSICAFVAPLCHLDQSPDEVGTESYLRTGQHLPGFTPLKSTRSTFPTWKELPLHCILHCLHPVANNETQQ